MQVFLAVSPTQVQSASVHCQSFAHMAYSIGNGSQLLRNNLLVQTKGGLLGLTDRDAPPIAAPEQLCAAVLRECARRSYTGVLADFEDTLSSDRRAFLERLAPMLRQSQRGIFAPSRYAVSGVTPLLCTATSGGNFREYLKESARGATPALDVQRLIMDFPLPSPSGEGKPLLLAELRRLIEEKQPTIFYAPELCAKYFTYTENGAGHFILFDDASTLNEKLRLAAAEGFQTAFFMYPEVEDLLGELFERLS